MKKNINNFMRICGMVTSGISNTIACDPKTKQQTYKSNTETKYKKIRSCTNT